MVLNEVHPEYLRLIANEGDTKLFRHILPLPSIPKSGNRPFNPPNWGPKLKAHITNEGKRVESNGGLKRGAVTEPYSRVEAYWNKVISKLCIYPRVRLYATMRLGAFLSPFTYQSQARGELRLASFVFGFMIVVIESKLQALYFWFI
jgi:hypothetical protein